MDKMQQPQESCCQPTNQVPAIGRLKTILIFVSEMVAMVSDRLTVFLFGKKFTFVLFKKVFSLGHIIIAYSCCD